MSMMFPDVPWYSPGHTNARLEIVLWRLECGEGNMEEGGGWKLYIPERLSAAKAADTK
jgi:hypothetical protein